MKFYLGTHKAAWLDRTEVPLFISRRQLTDRKTLPRATCRWALDSGGFTELSMYGRWTVSPKDYVEEVRRFADDAGNLDWAAQQDWMCEPQILKKTGKGIREHQRLTIENFLELKSLAPELPIAPVLQGWTLFDYYAHLEMWDAAGVDLTSEHIVGVGTMCRRQGKKEAEEILRYIACHELNLHGFGVKTQGLVRCSDVLASSDSTAWSFHARKREPLEGHSHATCANCMEYALRWREAVLGAVKNGLNGALDIRGRHLDQTAAMG